MTEPFPRQHVVTWWMLIAAYVILVAVVIVGIAVVNQQLALASAERCALAKAQLELTGVTLAAIGGIDPAPIAATDETRLRSLLEQIREDLNPESGCAFPAPG